MSFNLDPIKQAQEVIFSWKSKAISHPPLVFSNNNVIQTFLKKILVSFSILDCLWKNIQKQCYVKETKL